AEGGAEEVAAVALGLGDAEEAEGVGGLGWDGGAVAALAEEPGFDGGAGFGFTGLGVDHEAFDGLVGGDGEEGDGGDPGGGDGAVVVGLGKAGGVAGEDEVEAGRQGGGGWDGVAAGAVIRGGGEVDGPFERGGAGEPFEALAA